ncbi:MAG: ATP-binding cassette domain-containing protein, partial [Microbacterium gubbeenense]
MMSGLDLTDVRKGFGGAPVLDGVSLSVAPGEIVSLIGPSGSGKSTLLSLLTGALAPESGRMLFDGAPMTGRARPVAYMPQRDALLPWRRALDNAAVGLEVAGVRRREARQQA